MDILLNELSVHGQYPSLPDFVPALRTVLACRSLIKEFGHVLRCNGTFLATKPTDRQSVRELVQSMEDKNLKHSILVWLTKDGPFWDADREHGLDDLYVLKNTGKDVTDTSLAEAAFRRCSVLSFAPSDQFNHNKLKIDRIESDGACEEIEIDNFWERPALNTFLSAHEKPVGSWDELRLWALRACPLLCFADDVLAPMRGQPFVLAAAEQIQQRLSVLNQMKGCFNEDGSATDQWHEGYRKHFSGATAWFSDSSDTEKNRFRDKLTFRNPSRPDDRMLCGFHGKVRTGVLRIHFSWPMTKDDPLYVVYIGPKITKR